MFKMQMKQEKVKWKFLLYKTYKLRNRRLWERLRPEIGKLKKKEKP